MQIAETFNISMPQELAQAIRESVASGEFASTGEALLDAVRVWQQYRQEQAERLRAVRARIRRSLDDPRPALTDEELDASLNALFAEADSMGGDGAP